MSTMTEKQSEHTKEPLSALIERIASKNVASITFALRGAGIWPTEEQKSEMMASIIADLCEIATAAKADALAGNADTFRGVVDAFDAALTLERELAEAKAELALVERFIPDAIKNAKYYLGLETERDSLRSQLDAVTQELAEVKTKWPREYEKQNEALTAERDALRYAFEQLAKSLDNEADVDDGQPNDAMRFLTELRATLAATEPSK